MSRAPLRHDRTVMRGGRRIVATLVALLSLAASGRGASPPITAIAVAPAGGLIVAASQAGVVVRSWPAWESLRSLPIELTSVSDLAFSPDGTRLALSGGTPAVEGVVEVWSWPEGERLARCGEFRDVATGLSWSSDGRRLAISSLDHTVRIIDPRSGRELQRLEGHSRGVTAARFLPGDRQLVTAGLDQNLRLWDLGSGQVVRSFANHTAPIHDVAVKADGAGPIWAATVSDDRSVRFWQPAIGRMVRFARLDAVPLCVAWLPGRSCAAVGCADGHLRIIDAETAETVQDSPALGGWVYSLAPLPGGECVVAGAEGRIKAVPINLNVER